MAPPPTPSADDTECSGSVVRIWHKTGLDRNVRVIVCAAKVKKEREVVVSSCRVILRVVATRDDSGTPRMSSGLDSMPVVPQSLPAPRLAVSNVRFFL